LYLGKAESGFLLCPIRPRITVTEEKETKIARTRREKEDINEKAMVALRLSFYIVNLA